MPLTRPLSWPGFSAACAAILLWSAGNVIVRETPMSGVQIAFWRILLGAVVYWVALLPRRERLTWEQVRLSAPAGLALGAEIAVFFVALKTTTIANATIIGALQPVVLLVVAHRRFDERIRLPVVVAVAVALGGVVLVVSGSSQEATWSLRGDLLALAAMLLFSAYFTFAKIARRVVPAHQFQASVWIVGVLPLFPVAVIEAGGVEVPSPGQWAWLMALLVVPGTGHLLMNWAHAEIRLSVAGVLTLGVPVLSTIGAYLFLDEGLEPVQVLGMVTVVGSLVFVVLREAEVRRRIASVAPAAIPDAGAG